ALPIFLRRRRHVIAARPEQKAAVARLVVSPGGGPPVDDAVGTATARPTDRFARVWRSVGRAPRRPVPSCRAALAAHRPGLARGEEDRGTRQEPRLQLERALERHSRVAARPARTQED